MFIKVALTINEIVYIEEEEQIKIKLGGQTSFLLHAAQQAFT